MLLLTAGLLWTWSAGMDLNWDLVNYHFYGAYALLNGRLSQDYFGSLQGYFNPTIFIPFYLMVRSGMPSLAIVMLLALVHLINVFLAWQFTREMLAPAQRSSWLPWLGATLALIAPLFLTVLGNSFADALTSIPILCALFILSRERPKWSVARDPLVAGLLLGMAGGLKLTNAFLGVCACVTAAAMSDLTLRERVRQFFRLGVGGVAGLVLMHGYWSYELYRNFGSPVFPLFNNFFHSPDFVAEPFMDRRYIMGLAVWERLLLPLRMLQAREWVYSENLAPDLRPLALLLILALAFLRRRVRREHAAPHVLRWVTAYFLISFGVWIFVSSTGRYALPLLLLCGPLIVAWLAILVPDGKVLPIGLAVGVAQIALLANAGNPRWAAAAWSTPWVDVDVPSDLQSQPYLFLLTTNQSHAAIAAFLHPQSTLVALIGQYIQPIGVRMTPKLQRQLQRPVEEMRVVLSPRQLADLSVDTAGGAYRYRASPLLPYGLKVADDACEVINIRRRLFNGLLVPGRATQFLPRIEDAGSDSLVVCKVVRASDEEVAEVLRTLADAEKVLDRIEDACGPQLSPHRPQVAYYYMKPYRNYLNTDNQLVYDLAPGTVRLVNRGGSTGEISLGGAAAWMSDHPPRCPRFPPSAPSSLTP